MASLDKNLHNYIEEIERERPTFDKALEALNESEGRLPDPDILIGFSGMTDTQYAEFAPVWGKFGTTFQRVLLQSLADIADSNLELDYTTIAEHNLRNEDAGVRQAAIEILAEVHTPELMYQLIDMVRSDDDTNVRAEAMRGIGRFVLAGELGELDDQVSHDAQQIALDVINDSQQAPEVQRYAVEAIANCSRPEVTNIIHAAYQSDDAQLRISAVAAMGKSCDAQWELIVMNELESSDDDMQLNAARAAGDLQLTAAVPLLGQMLDYGDRVLKEVAIWSMGEIGSKEAVRILEAFAEVAEEAEDDQLLEVTEDAISNASLMNGDLFSMFDFDDESI